MKTRSILLLAALTTLALGIAWFAVQAADGTVPVTFTGGHDTDPRDGGRPIILIAAALEVTPDVFRDAFKGVTPARDGKPSPEQAKSNKSALMKALKPHGVTNERLDEVSDYYRYQPQRGELWRHSPAKAHAILEDGTIKQIVITDPGSGYSAPPTATLKGMETKLKVAIRFDKAFKKNGSISAIEVE